MEGDLKCLYLGFFQFSHRQPKCIWKYLKLLSIAWTPTLTLCLLTWNWSMAAWTVFAYLAKEAQKHSLYSVLGHNIDTRTELLYHCIIGFLLSSVLIIVISFPLLYHLTPVHTCHYFLRPLNCSWKKKLTEHNE